MIAAIVPGVPSAGALGRSNRRWRRPPATQITSTAATAMTTANVVAASGVGVVSDEQRRDHRDELGAAVGHERALGLQTSIARSLGDAPRHAVAMRTNATIATMATPAAARGTNGDGGSGAPRRIACCTARHRR